MVMAVLEAAVVGRPVTASLKVAVTLAVRLTPVAADAGLFAVIVGRGPVMKLQLWAASAPPLALLIPDVRDAV